MPTMRSRLVGPARDARMGRAQAPVMGRLGLGGDVARLLERAVCALSARRADERRALAPFAGIGVELFADVPAALLAAALAGGGMRRAQGAERDLVAVPVLRASRLGLRGQRLGLEERPVDPHLVGHRRGGHFELAGDLPKRCTLFEHFLYLAPVVEAQVRSLLLRHDILLPRAGRGPSMVGKQREEENRPMLRPKGLRMGRGLAPRLIARSNWTGVQLANSINV